MTEKSKRTVTVIAASTALSYLADMVIFSLGRRELTFPKGKEAAQLLGVGLLMGLALDFSINKIDYALKTQEERELDKLVDKEKEKIYAGIIKNQIPTQVEWKKALGL